MKRLSVLMSPFTANTYLDSICNHFCPACVPDCFALVLLAVILLYVGYEYGVVFDTLLLFTLIFHSDSFG